MVKIEAGAPDSVIVCLLAFMLAASIFTFFELPPLAAAAAALRCLALAMSPDIMMID